MDFNDASTPELIGLCLSANLLLMNESDYTLSIVDRVRANQADIVDILNVRAANGDVRAMNSLKEMGEWRG